MAAMQGAMEQFGVQYLERCDMQTRESNQRPSDNKTPALPLSHSCPRHHLRAAITGNIRPQENINLIRLCTEDVKTFIKNKS